MSIESVLTNWDGDLTCSRFDSQTGAFFTIAVHSRVLGPAAGGTRAMTYASPTTALEDATRLASAMTLKMAAADLPMGGGKSVIALPSPRASLSAEHWRRILDVHADNLSTLAGRYWTGPDVGTTSEDMDVLHETSGFAFGRTPAAGGPGSSAPETAHGVFVAIKVAAHEAGLADLNGQRVLVQGLGAVGMDVARMVANEGANVIACDTDPSRCRAASQEFGARIIEREAVLAQQSDVFVPCATGNLIDGEVAREIKTRVVAGAANNLLRDVAAGDILAGRGVVLAPDFVANAGGAIHLVGREVLGWTADEVHRQVENIGHTLTQLFELARSEGISTERAARILAEARFKGRSASSHDKVSGLASAATV